MIYSAYLDNGGQLRLWGMVSGLRQCHSVPQLRGVPRVVPAHRDDHTGAESQR